METSIHPDLVTFINLFGWAVVCNFGIHWAGKRIARLPAFFITVLMLMVAGVAFSLTDKTPVYAVVQIGFAWLTLWCAWGEYKDFRQFRDYA